VIESLARQFVATVGVQAAGLGVDLLVSGSELESYAAQRMGHLKRITGQLGYEEAVEAEAHNVMLFALGRSIEAADAQDRFLVGIAHGLLGMAGRALLG